MHEDDDWEELDEWSEWDALADLLDKAGQAAVD
jgi:hypothetical protein